MAVAELEEKTERKKRVTVPIFPTEAEFRTFTLPPGYKPYLCQIPGLNDQHGKPIVGFTADTNPQGALVRFAMHHGGVASKLGKTPDKDRVFGELMAMGPEGMAEMVARATASMPPDHMKRLVAQINASAHLAGDSPTGNKGAKR